MYGKKQLTLALYGECVKLIAPLPAFLYIPHEARIVRENAPMVCEVYGKAIALCIEAPDNANAVVRRGRGNQPSGGDLTAKGQRKRLKWYENRLASPSLQSTEEATLRWQMGH